MSTMYKAYLPCVTDRKKITFLTLMSDQKRISLFNTNTTSSRQVMRITIQEKHELVDF